MTVAKMAVPEIAEMIDRAQFGAFATSRPDGTPHLSYISFIRDGEAFLIACQNYRVKYRNLLANPRAALMVVDATNPMRMLSMTGTVQVIEAPAGNDVLLKVQQRLATLTGGTFKGEVKPSDTLAALRFVPEKAFTYGYEAHS